MTRSLLESFLVLSLTFCAACAIFGVALFGAPDLTAEALGGVAAPYTQRADGQPTASLPEHSAAPVPRAETALRAFIPEPIPLGEPELVNPLRGLYQWRGHELMPTPDPLPRPAFEAYERYEWRDLEPEPDRYDFSAIEHDLSTATAEGRRFAFRIRAVVSGQQAVPDYLVREMRRGWWFDYDDDGSAETYVPDWNDPLFVARAEKLIAALGARYNGDPRVAFVDIGMYGNWGEWHMFGFPYPAPGGAERIRDEVKHALVDLHLHAFPDTFLLVMSNDTEAVMYALRRSPRVGWRRDSLGDPHFEDVRADPQRWALLSERWRSAPVVTEFINPGKQSDPEVFERALEQTRRYHVSLVGNGNTFDWEALSDEGRAAFVELAKRAGYRLRLNRLELPPTLRAGEALPLKMLWSNEGSAPLYESWQLVVQLRPSGSEAVAWEAISALDLREVLPAADPAAPAPTWLHDDTFRLPVELAPGRYDLAVLVRDPSGQLAPLALPIRGRQSDGAYTLGTVELR
jgi:hypothetical protein